MNQSPSMAVSALKPLQDETKGKYLTFLTDGQRLGVPIADVVQIVGMQDITEIPGYPAYAKRVINLRGAIIPVIDVYLTGIARTSEKTVLLPDIESMLMGRE